MSGWTGSGGVGGIQTVAGTVADATTSSGNPVSAGGIYQVAPPTYTDGQRTTIHTGQRGSTWSQIMLPDSAAAIVGGAAADAASSSSNLLFVRSSPMMFNGSTYDRTRTPTMVKTVTATASGSTAVWTPTTGKKFRLMGYEIGATANVATLGGAIIEAVLLDSAAALGVGLSFFAPNAAGSTYGPNDRVGSASIGNGLLSATANNVLNISLSAALTSGEIRVTVWGTEE